MPYRARINERTLLNLPGFHDAAFVYTYVEDTSERELQRHPKCDDDGCKSCPWNFEPRMILEIADCSNRIALEFDIDSERGTRQLAAQARHADRGPARLPPGRHRRVRAVRPASARARRVVRIVGHKDVRGRASGPSLVSRRSK